VRAAQLRAAYIAQRKWRRASRANTPRQFSTPNQ
jgi:hypothetical protein